MNCKLSESCVYYRTHQYTPNSRQSRFLVENYCEGALQSRCRRIQYKLDNYEEPPVDLAPNGYLVGTHKKLMTDNTRKFERYKIKNGACLLQVLDTQKTFSAGIIDVSKGGMRLELSVHPEELKICSKKSLLKILSYSLEDIPFTLTKDIVKMVWQSNRIVGCSFADPLPAL